MSENTGPLWSDTPATDTKDAENAAILEHYKRLIAELDEARVVELFWGETNEVVRKMPDPFLSFMIQRGVEGAGAQANPYGPGVEQGKISLSAACWEEMCKRCAKTQDEAIMSPLRAKLLERAAWGTYSLAYHRPGTSQAQAYSEMVEEVSRGQIDLGEGVRENMSRFVAWIGNAQRSADVEGLDMLDKTNQPLYSSLWPIVLKLAPIAGKREASGSLLVMATKNAAAMEVLAGNRAWNEEGWRGMMDYVLADLDSWVQVPETTVRKTDTATISELVAQAKQHGWQMDGAQEVRLGQIVATIAQEKRRVANWLELMGGRPGRKGAKRERARWQKWSSHSSATGLFESLVQLPSTATLEPVRQYIIETTEASAPMASGYGYQPIVLPMLSNARGKGWLEVATSIANVMDKNAGTQWVVGRLNNATAPKLAEATTESLEGLSASEISGIVSRFARFGAPVADAARRLETLARAPERPAKARTI